MADPTLTPHEGLRLESAHVWKLHVNLMIYHIIYIQHIFLHIRLVANALIASMEIVSRQSPLPNVKTSVAPGAVGSGSRTCCLARCAELWLQLRATVPYAQQFNPNNKHTQLISASLGNLSLFSMSRTLIWIYQQWCWMLLCFCGGHSKVNVKRCTESWLLPKIGLLYHAPFFLISYLFIYVLPSTRLEQ